MRARLVLSLSVLLLGCETTAEDVRIEPVRWSARYEVPFDTMANCLASGWSHAYAVTPLVYPREGIARVTMANKQAPMVMSEYEIRKLGEGTSEVQWRRRKILADLGGVEAKMREVADKCAQP